MASRYKFVPIADFRGGRNATDNPMDLAPNQVMQARNGDVHRTSGFRKRGGATAPAIGSAFTSVISSLIAHTPANNLANAELWGVDAAATPIVGRMAGATTFSAVTMADAITPATDSSFVRGASYNGKLFLVFNSAVNRLHCWDPTLATPKVRRAGLATPSAVTVANTGAGTYAATQRWYRQRDRIKNGSVIVAQSEASASTAFTPSGTGTAARVTRVTTASDAEVTHWMLEASDDNVTFYELAETAVGTTTYDDSAAVSSYSSGTISAVTGTYTVPGSWRYIKAAFNRLFGLGNWESGQPQSRLWFTPGAGTADRGDDERIPDTTNTNNWRDLDEGTGGDGTGFAGPINGALYVFKYSQIWKVVPTEAPGNPIDAVDITKVKGALQQEAITEGLDAEGRPVIYFVDPQVGPCVLGSSGPRDIGRGVRDLWDDVNLAAATKVADCVFYAAKGAKGQVWFGWATGSAAEPDIMAIYDVETGGWSAWDTGGRIRLHRAMVLFARTPGASMSRDVVPYVSDQGFNNRLIRCDTTDLNDNATTFQATVKTAPLVLNEGKPFSVGTPFVFAEAASGVTLTVTLDVDFGRVTRTGTVLLTADGSETHVFRRVEGLESGDQARAIQLEIGDAAAAANAWSFNRFFVPITLEDIGP